ncbi:MAG: phytanoyl-CoA dioxygenase [Verrucomicrobiaceae bacterium]|nr:MAG: phytanoyl-CoA dioxygenase [Verrucomicrobiaceae bacterium]
MNFDEEGFTILTSRVPEQRLEELRGGLFAETSAGERCLLDHPAVRDTACLLKEQLVKSGHLSAGAVAIQAIAFDKTAATNWKVAWHQDLMFPFAQRVSSPGFELPCIKQEVHYARPPADVLAGLLAVRLHLDDCDATNGPLRISPGTHRSGIHPTATVSALVEQNGERVCLAKTGEVLLMRPLSLHASSQATAPKHRRVLHLVFHSGEPVPEKWHRAV